ncbi:MAG TPA: hypothetical protein VNK67_05855 [Burkholderiales bacterium]|nr:hypothetical protein [Burkholderiales bacterium]
MRVQVLVDHLEHDGKRVKQGVVIDVSESAANALIALGVAHRVGEDKPEEHKRKKGD